MGIVHASVELINSTDKENARRGIMDPDEVRRIGVRAMVDSGALHMAINQNIQEYLQLPVVGKEQLVLASGEVVYYDIVAPLEVRFEEYSAHCAAVVLPGDSEPLLGAIPMEAMNVVIHPSRRELVHSSKPAPLVSFRLSK